VTACFLAQAARAAHTQHAGGEKHVLLSLALFRLVPCFTIPLKSSGNDPMEPASQGLAGKLGRKKCRHPVQTSPRPWGSPDNLMNRGHTSFQSPL
jgi:hypothetical protein